MSSEFGEAGVDDVVPVTATLSLENDARRYEPDQTAGDETFRSDLGQIKLKHDTWVEEYRSLRAEIIAIGTSARQGTQVAIVAIAAVISLAGYIVQNDLPILFLLAPFIFYALAWMQLRLAFTARSISDYIVEPLAENTNRAMVEAESPGFSPHMSSDASGNNQETQLPFGWEAASSSHMHSDRRRLWLLETSAFAIPAVVAMSLPGGYLAYVSHYHARISGYALTYVIMNEVLCVYTLMMGSWIRRFNQGIRGYSTRVPNRYSDLVAYQVAHAVQFFYRRSFPCDNPLPNDACSLPWHSKEVPKLVMNRYRAGRCLFWAFGVWLTFQTISGFNEKQGTYAEKHQKVLALTNGDVVKGIPIGYDGKNYVMMVKGDKEEIDAALVTTIQASPVVSVTTKASSMTLGKTKTVNPNSR
ncbi:MAG: hypothetical protein ACRYFS_19780 [Janthinobacterium lividum]